MMLAASQRALSNQSSSSSSVLENADAKRSMVADVTVAVSCNTNNYIVGCVERERERDSRFYYYASNRKIAFLERVESNKESNRRSEISFYNIDMGDVSMGFGESTS